MKSKLNDLQQQPLRARTILHLVRERNIALRNKTIEIRILCKQYCQLQFMKNR